jgi:hypothetical protein
MCPNYISQYMVNHIIDKYLKFVYMLVTIEFDFVYDFCAPRRQVPFLLLH